MVIAPANTGKDNRSRTTVIKIDHTNKGIKFSFITGDRMFKIVVIKLIAPRILDTPAKCKEKIVKSTDAPA
jgi:hypothetical protein